MIAIGAELGPANASDAVRVTIPGPPCAQGRGRAVRAGGTGHVMIADPPKSKSWKGAAQVHMQAVVAAPLSGPLAVAILAVFPCPTSDYRKRDPRGRRWHTKANGDADNIAKACLDAGNGVLWLDDSCVSRLSVEKVVGAQGEVPRVEIVVRCLREHGGENEIRGMEKTP